MIYLVLDVVIKFNFYSIIVSYFLMHEFHIHGFYTQGSIVCVKISTLFATCVLLREISLMILGKWKGGVALEKLVTCIIVYAVVHSELFSLLDNAPN